MLFLHVVLFVCRLCVVCVFVCCCVHVCVVEQVVLLCVLSAVCYVLCVLCVMRAVCYACCLLCAVWWCCVVFTAVRCKYTNTQKTKQKEADHRYNT